MRMHIKPRATLLTLCLSLAAAAAFAGDGTAAQPAPPAPPAPAAAVVAPNPPDTDEAAVRASVDAAHRSEEAVRRQQDVLRAKMDVARRQMEVAAQQLAALSAQMYGPMMQQRFRAFAGPPHALIGVQLGQSSGEAGARVREVSPGGAAEQAGVRTGDLIVAVNGTQVGGREPAGRVVELLHDVKPGDKVALEISRGGKTRNLTMTARPDGNAFFVGPRVLGLPPMPQMKVLAPWGGVMIRGPVADMELARLTPGLGRYFGTDTGVLVVRAPPAGGLGLQDGDVILSIDGREPIDSSHVIRILGSYDPGEKITLQVLRLHHRMTVATTLPAGPQISGRGFEMPRGFQLQPGPVVRLRRGAQTY